MTVNDLAQIGTHNKREKKAYKSNPNIKLKLTKDNIELVPCESAPHGVFRSNKIILTNPKKVTDDLAMEFYLKFNLPEKSYYKSLASCAISSYRNTSLKIIRDKVNKDNIDLVLNEIDDFTKPYSNENSNNNKVLDEVMELLYDIKNNN